MKEKFDIFQREDGKFYVCQTHDSDGNELYYYRTISPGFRYKKQARLFQKTA